MCCDAQADTDRPQPVQQVHVNADAAADAGRDVAAGKIIVGRQRIADSGVQNVGELLKREPAISIGKDGRLGMLGLPGYTQVLVDGAPYSGDPFALDLVHIERIEILKTSTAATGPFGIAGTINILRKKAEPRSFQNLRAGGSALAGRLGADLGWSSNAVAQDSPLITNLSLSASRKPTRGDHVYAQTRQGPDGAAGPVFAGERATRGTLETLTAGSEFTWTLNADHKISLSPDGGRVIIASEGSEGRRWSDAGWYAGRSRNREAMTGYSLPLRWNWRIDDASSLALKLNRNSARFDIDARGADSWSDGRRFQRLDSQVRDTTDTFLHLDYYRESAGGHEITAGSKLFRNRQDAGYANTVNGQQDASLAALGLRSASRIDGAQVFVQDEWRIDRTLALNLGASVETRRYALDEGSAASRQRFTMWSPSAHLSKKIGGNRQRLVRFSVAQSFQPPGLLQMQLHPSTNEFAPCAPGALCGANGIDTADASGNPALQPERALGLNLSYTHGIGKGSELTLELYAREIHDKIGSEIGLFAVPWASAPRYLVRPANLGDAWVRGLNLEGRIAARDVWKTAPQAELHGSLGWSRSRVDALRGPDNRLEGQSPFRAKLGGSYVLQAAPVKIGVEGSYLPDDWVRSNLSERVYQSSKTGLGANASWTFPSKARLTLNLDDLLHRDSRSVRTYLGSPELLQLDTRSSNHARVTLRYETKL
ncbi:MAG: TonB-dependent receptor plug domain-containing protein [Pseudomonadota bacterium]